MMVAWMVESSAGEMAEQTVVVRVATMVVEMVVESVVT